MRLRASVRKIIGNSRGDTETRSVKLNKTTRFQLQNLQETIFENENSKPHVKLRASVREISETLAET